MVKYIIMRDGEIICQTTVPYPSFIIKDMKQFGYTIKVEKTKED